MRLLEPLRALLRYIVPTSTYKKLSSATNRITSYWALGYDNYKELYSPPRETLSRINIKGTAFYFRPGTPDTDAIIQNIARHEWLQSPLPSAKYILDGGAYIGDSTLAFLLRYPKASIICVEPNPKTQMVLKRNLESFAKNTTLVSGGISDENKQAAFGGEFLHASLHSDALAQGELVNCYCINSLMKEHSIPFFDIVKLDIEGAERDVLINNNEWLHKTRRLIVEFHGQKIADTCIKALLNQGFSHFQFRSVHYFDSAFRPGSSENHVSRPLQLGMQKPQS